MSGIPIEWNGQVVGHIEGGDSDPLDFTVSWRMSKMRGRWVPLANQAAEDFLAEVSQRTHVEVNTPSRTLGDRVIFSLGFDNEAWLLYLRDPDWLARQFDPGDET
jgi:hypothetical protein